MIDLKHLREAPDHYREGCRKKNIHADIDRILALDAERRSLQSRADALKAEQNRIAKETGPQIGKLQGAIKAAAPADRARLEGELAELKARPASLKEEIAAFLEQKDVCPEHAEQFDALAQAMAELERGLSNFGAWLSAGEMEQIYLMATRFLNAFGDVVVAWLLLENAVAATRAQQTGDADYDAEFCEGKVYAMRYFYRNTLAHLGSKLAVIATVDPDFKALGTAHFPRVQ